MLRVIRISLLAAMSLVLAFLLGGCGSSNKEDTTGGVATVAEAACRVCHADSLDPVSFTPILQEYLGSVHNSDAAGCQGCHGGGAQHNGVGPIPFTNPLASNRCVVCHTKAPAAAVATNFVGNCAPCHSNTADTTRGLHAAKKISALTVRKPDDCVGCHDIAAPQHGPNLVGDNNGVRAIVQEFNKWSHHVTGVNLQNAHCAACHLEGRVDAGAIVVDTAYHMADNMTHLRNADTDADMQWNPETPNHSTMDVFCMSCHDADGATSAGSAAVRALMVPAVGKTASALNPFGDTISNRYDKMQRPAVVNVDSQFNITNNSQHGVKGPRYSGRTRTAGPRQIASPATFANNSSPLLQGLRTTIFDAGNFNSVYVPLENAGGEAAPRTGAADLGDDSTLHCGDCHTVGQWKPGSSVDRLGRPTPAAIGAHGSNNEYLLRNSIGTDQRHTQNAFVNVGGVVTYTNPDGAFIVCYNCHSYNKYGSIYLRTGNNGSHAGEYDTAARCNGIGNTLSFNGYTTGAATDGTQFTSRFLSDPPTIGQPGYPGYPGEQLSSGAAGGNIFGIQCMNCHNSGVGNAFGGIHGSPNNTPFNDGITIINPDPSVTGGAYIDGLGNTTKVQRFLPGLGNTMYVPGTLGGYGTTGRVVPTTESGLTYTYTTGGITADSNWEQKYGRQILGTIIPPGIGTVIGEGPDIGAGCYTLGGATAVGNNQRGPSVTGEGGPATAILNTWGGCTDHGEPLGGPGERQLKNIVRPVTY